MGEREDCTPAEGPMTPHRTAHPKQGAALGEPFEVLVDAVDVPLLVGTQGSEPASELGLPIRSGIAEIADPLIRLLANASGAAGMVGG